MATHGLTMASSPRPGSVWARPNFNVTAAWIYRLQQQFSERFGEGSVMSVSQVRCEMSVNWSSLAEV